MQVTLLEKVANLGNLGDVVKVKDGFARNFLIPTRRARRATESAMKEFEAKRAELDALAEKYEDEIYQINKVRPLKVEIVPNTEPVAKPAPKPPVKKAA